MIKNITPYNYIWLLYALWHWKTIKFRYGIFPYNRLLCKIPITKIIVLSQWCYWCRTLLKPCADLFKGERDGRYPEPTYHFSLFSYICAPDMFSRIKMTGDLVKLRNDFKYFIFGTCFNFQCDQALKVVRPTKYSLVRSRQRLIIIIVISIKCCGIVSYRHCIFQIFDLVQDFWIKTLESAAAKTIYI